MDYFSGFCLSGESQIFDLWLKNGDMSVSGFSYGAIKAFEHTLEFTKRIDRLMLFSPAFFQNKKKRFIEFQIKAWEKDPPGYMRTFLEKCAEPGQDSLLPWLKPGNKKELEYLLNYKWSREKIASLLKKGIRLEVFFGAKDKIIDSKAACDFFSEAGAVCCCIKEAGHTLRPILKILE